MVVVNSVLGGGLEATGSFPGMRDLRDAGWCCVQLTDRQAVTKIRARVVWDSFPWRRSNCTQICLLPDQGGALAGNTSLASYC